jgi:vancomycin resistance protein YoaR
MYVCMLTQAFANLVRQEYFVKDVKKSLAAQQQQQQQHGVKNSNASSSNSRTHAARARSASHTTAADGSSSSGATGISVVKGMNLLPGDTYSFTKVIVVSILLLLHSIVRIAIALIVHL